MENLSTMQRGISPRKARRGLLFYVPRILSTIYLQMVKFDILNLYAYQLNSAFKLT